MWLAHALHVAAYMTRGRHLGSWTSARYCFLLVTVVARMAMAQEEPKTQVLFMLPFASGAGFVRRDAVRVTNPNLSSDNDIGTAQYAWFGLSIGHDWNRNLRSEIYAAVVGVDEQRPRGLIGLRAGPVLPLLDRGDGDAPNVAVRFVTMGGIAYRGQMYEWLHSSGWCGQRSLALTVTPALEATYYSSPSLGWTLRFKPEFSYVFDQIGSPVWIESEEGYTWDGYRWGLTGGMDVGVVF